MGDQGSSKEDHEDDDRTRLTRERIETAGRELERRYGITPDEQKWLPCENNAMLVEFRGARNGQWYIGRLDLGRNVLRVFSHHRCINLQ